MTTFTQFTPPPASLFAFQPTLDGAVYSATVVWNLAGQRWYLQLTDLSGNLIVLLPLIGSPIGSDINLVAGYFQTSTLVYREDTGNFEVSP